MKVDIVFETRGHSRTNTQTEDYYQIEDKTIVIKVVKEGVDLLEVKQIRTFLVVGVISITS